MWFKNLNEFIEYVGGDKVVSKLKNNILITYNFSFGDNKYVIEKCGKLHLRNKNHMGIYGSWEALEKKLIKIEPMLLKKIIRKKKIENMLL